MSDARLAAYLSACLFFGSISIATLFFFPRIPWIVAIAIALFAFFHGPTNGFCLDLNNRLTLPTEKSTSILMFGINCGDSFVPYIVASVWKFNNNNPVTLIYFMFGSLFIPFGLTPLAQALSYKRNLDDFELRREKSSYYYEIVMNVATVARRVSVKAVRRLSATLGYSSMENVESFGE